MQISLFDIDGVLANDNHRAPFAKEGQWNRYFQPSIVGVDPVWEQGRALVNERLMAGDDVQYLTGRRGDLRDVTGRWLHQNGFPDGVLGMRPFPAPYAKVPLANFKVDYIEKIREANPNVLVVLYDDDPEVVRLVRKTFGDEAAVHCTWHIKHKYLVKSALA